ncbi:MAG: shikimate kinase [Candidatus Micrarchaeia archaeon]
MKRAKNIFLVGFMGTGKSAVGKALADRLGMKFVDTDEEIEAKAKMPIKDIFAKYGEEHFRNIEKEVVRRVSKNKNAVIACGGGVMLFEGNVENLKKNGIIVCLTASPEEIAHRVGINDERPLLKGKTYRERLKEIKKLLKKRSEYYAKSDYFVDTNGRGVEEIVGEIEKIVRGS